MRGSWVRDPADPFFLQTHEKPVCLSDWLFCFSKRTGRPRCHRGILFRRVRPAPVGSANNASHCRAVYVGRLPRLPTRCQISTPSPRPLAVLKRLPSAKHAARQNGYSAAFRLGAAICTQSCSRRRKQAAGLSVRRGFRAESGLSLDGIIATRLGYDAVFNK